MQLSQNVWMPANYAYAYAFAPPSIPVVDACDHGAANDGMSDAGDAFASALRAALVARCGASLKIPRGLYRFDTEFEVIVAGVDDLGSRIVHTSFLITYAEARALGFKVPADAPPHERPRGGPYDCKRAAFLSSWTSDDEDYGIASDGMTDDAVALGLLLIKAGEAYPSFVLDFPRGMLRIESDIEVYVPAAERSLGGGVAVGNRILVTEQANVFDSGVWLYDSRGVPIEPERVTT